MSALLFGSISTRADTSELQREAFNAAFARHGLPWRWTREQYRSMLAVSGGENRIAEHARAEGRTVDAAAVHRTKSEIFRDSLAAAPVRARAGVVDAIRAAQRAGTKVAFVTTTSPENVAALLAALRPELSARDFDLVVDSSVVPTPKPDPAAPTAAGRRCSPTSTPPTTPSRRTCARGSPAARSATSSPAWNPGPVSRPAPSTRSSPGTRTPAGRRSTSPPRPAAPP